MDTPAFLHGYAFSSPVAEVRAYTTEEVLPALERLERHVAEGLHAAGFVSYEAASALNGDLDTRPPGDLPLLWFALFEKRSPGRFPESSRPFSCGPFEISLSGEQFGDAVRSIRELIADGECYQVNLTMRQRFSFTGCPRSFFTAMRRSQPTPYSGYLEAGRYRILSASPELFFSLTSGILTTRPMKGTSTRGRWSEEDQARKEQLRQSSKERAENVMIVDLLRNDMGIVSRTGSVRVSSLFDVETHPTVHQMTSTIRSRVNDGVSAAALFRALFPCGSVTGAPKRRSMQAIADLEDEPRGVYTGCIGYFSPGNEACFSVAIRTAVIDMELGRGEIGIGSGITYDSVARDEYAESLAKGCFAREFPPEFHLLESLLFEGGYFLLEKHLERLQRSAEYFAVPLSIPDARKALEKTASLLDGRGRYKVRLLLFRDGSISCESAMIPNAAAEATAAFAKTAVASSNPFLYHKTSRRDVYERELAARPDVGEVIFINERGEVTEGANSNVVALLGGEYLTPPLACGLLPGTFRAELLTSGQVREQALTREELEAAEAVFLVNSVRKWRRVQMVR